MSKTLSTSVVIIGGGPVGLAMGLLLHRRQINCMVFEQTSGTIDNPKSRGCWIRTIEPLRQWDIEEKVRARRLPDGSPVQTGTTSNDAKTAAGGHGSGHSVRPTWHCSGAPRQKGGVTHRVAGQRPNRRTIESPYQGVDLN